MYVSDNAREAIRWMLAPGAPDDPAVARRHIIDTWGKGVFMEVVGLMIAGVIREIQDSTGRTPCHD